jgi:hypothetical protein
MKLWAMSEAGLADPYKFELDLHAEVYEACAYHRWVCSTMRPMRSELILGGGVPRTITCSRSLPGPGSSLPNVRGYNFDVQMSLRPSPMDRYRPVRLAKLSPGARWIRTPTSRAPKACRPITPW